MRKQRWMATAAFALSASLAIAGIALAGGQSQLAGVRQATAPLRDATRAEAAGYERFLPCFESSAGGMGQHYVDLSRLDGVIEPNNPEALVYEVRGDDLKLVAVEYIVPQAAWGPTAPRLFGHDFTKNDTLGIWALHAWIWRPNPDGMFANYNPSVRGCP